MADRPIIFSGPMVRALLGGTKTQTRRILKTESAICREPAWEAKKGADGVWRLIAESEVVAGSVTVTLRTGAGDRLWVRENWSHSGSGVWTIANARSGLGGGAPVYMADGRLPWAKYWPSIHMPREFSRLTLHVAEVRVQRLQDISLADCLAEGCLIDPDYRDTTADKSSPPMVLTGPAQWITPRGWYHQLWDDINGASAWDRNPWVVAYTFTVEHANIDLARAAA